MQTDSSNNRTYLTRTNNYYEKPHEIPDDPQIIADRRRRNEELKQRRPPCQPGSNLLRNIKIKVPGRSSSREAAEGTMTPIDDMTAFPESSDEDEQVQSALAGNALLPTPEPTQTNKSKRALAETNGNASASRRSKRAKTTAGEEQQEQKSSSQPLQTPNMNGIPASQGSDLFLSQLSQSSQRKRTQKYGNKKAVLWKPSASPTSPEKETIAGLQVPDSIPSTPALRASKEGTDHLKLPKLLSSPIAPAKLFLPTFDETQLDINTETEDDVLDSKHQRKGSSSSLSSLDSFASARLDRKTKHRLNNDFNTEKSASKAPDGYVRCPRCKHDTLKEGLLTLKGKKDVNKLSHKDSQKFCYEHRIRDAKQAWKTAHYPDSDLDTLTSSTRISNYLTNLLPIIQRKRKSFYLDKLDDAVANAKGNQKKINTFFQTEIMTLTHNGYYGPGGRKRLALAIAMDEKLSKQFKRAERSDKTFRTANFARATDSFLLPELLVMLVQDDMYLAHDEDGEADARKILEESEEIGTLLNGDDNDEVDEAREDDDVV